jgi:hypothetical protein
MRIATGLFDHMVLQRDRRSVSDAAVTGTCAEAGVVLATVKAKGRVLSGWSARRVGAARAGAFRARLAGLPAGGPYAIELAVAGPDGRAVESRLVKDVLVGDVWILAGQSNMQGCGRLNREPRPDPLVRAFYMGDRWGVAKDPLHNMWATVDQVHIDYCGGQRPPKWGGTGAGHGVAFGQELRRRLGVPQGVLACAHGGTSMEQWDPAKKHLGGGSLYGASLRRVAKNGGRVAGIAWYQGESDAGPEAAALYTARMRTLIGSFRRDLKAPRLPFVLVQIARCIHDLTDARAWNSVQEQERRLPELVPACATVPAIDLALDDGVHISGRETVRLGRRLADAACHLLGMRGSRPTIAVRGTSVVPGPMPDGPDVEVRFDHVVGGLRSRGEPLGFALVDGMGAGHVLGVTLKGNRAILRTSLPRGRVMAMSLHYGLGFAPVCTITDATDRSLPVFGPLALGKLRAQSGFIQNLEVSALLPSAGTLGRLAYPANAKPLRFARHAFPAQFCSLHPELEAKKPDDVLVFFRHRFRCAEAMRLGAHLGYDGPLKVWVDGRKLLHDSKGTNPALPEDALVRFAVGAGQHELLVALASNHGKAWGIYLSLERYGLSSAALKRGGFAMPEAIA